MTTIQIRRATVGDAPALLYLIDALADYEQLPRPDDAARARLVSDAFEREPARFEAYLAWAQTGDSATAIGYALMFETYSSFLARPTLYLEDLFVLPQARKMGAGRSLLTFLASEAVRRECGRMDWVCLDWNELAQNFYAHIGAVQMPEWLSYRMEGEALRAFAETQPSTAPP